MLTDQDLETLRGIVAALEGYFRVDEGDPTGRAHALKQVARRAATGLGADPADAAHALGERLGATA